MSLCILKGRDYIYPLNGNQSTSTMSKQSFSILRLFDRMPGWAFASLVFLYCILMTFQGLDLADEGLNAVFYRNIYTDPEAVQYTFMFWLSGVIGGAFELLFPGMGVWGHRLVGAITLGATCLLAFKLLRPYLGKAALRLGLLFALLVIANNIRMFHYNYLCMLLYMLCALFLFNGLKHNKPYLLFLAGMMVAFETLARIPSLVNLGLVLAIFYYGYLQQYSWGRMFRLAFIFGGGFIGGLGVMVAFGLATGQLEIFLSAVKLVMEMGSGDASSHYGLGKLLKQFFLLYGSAVKHGLLIGIPVLGAAMLCNIVQYRPAWRKPLIRALIALFVLAFAWLIWTNKINHLIMVFLLTDLSMLAALLIFLTVKHTELRVLALMGLYIILTYPLGSSDGIYTVGIYTLWIGLPIAIDYFARWNQLESNWKLDSNRSGWNLKIWINHQQFKTIGFFACILIFFALLRQAYYYPFFDWNERTRMTAQVDNPYLRHVYTTPERAAVINELLNESARHIQPGDTVMMYHSIPLLHYLTNTRPFLRNAMPWLYEGSFFANELRNTVEKTGTIPVIVRQLIKTVGDASYWPNPPLEFDETWASINSKRDEALENFLREFGYREVWSNGVFAIYIPGGKL